MKNSIDKYFDRLKSAIDALDRQELDYFIQILLKARDNDKHIYIMGNGGSAATASHFVCDFNKGMSYQQDKKFKMICLNDNVATMLAYSNDVGYEDVFVEQLRNFLKKDDVVIGISGSGNSKNILKAVDYANSVGAVTIGLTGFNGGELKKKASMSVNANIDDMQISEDIHMMICHMIYNILMSKTTKSTKEMIYG